MYFTVDRGVVMVGPGFAISSQYFREIGTYDDGMKIWGGENLELAWRVSRELETHTGGSTSSPRAQT